MTEFYRNHRIIGYKVASVTIGDGELTVLQTAPNKQDVAPSRLLMEVTEQDRLFEAKMKLAEAIEYGVFLAISPDALRSAFTDMLEVIIERTETARKAAHEQADQNARDV